jgi:hypothetical protein
MKSGASAYRKLDGIMVKPLGLQSAHLSVGLTGLENLEIWLRKSFGVISGRCDNSNETKPDTSGAA